MYEEVFPGHDGFLDAAVYDATGMSQTKGVRTRQPYRLVITRVHVYVYTDTYMYIYTYMCMLCICIYLYVY